MFASKQQNNWPTLLLLAQFVYNNTIHNSTKTTLFYAVYGKHPLLTKPPVDSRQEGEVLNTVHRVKRIHSARAALTEHLKRVCEY